MSETARQQAQRLAKEYLSQEDALGWFEALYAQASKDPARIPWADLVPNPNLVEWLDQKRIDGTGRRALKVGCGLGDDAEELARWGFETVAFDVSPTAIQWCRERFPGSKVDYTTADLFQPPTSWLRRFDLVLESYTLQVLPPRIRPEAAQRIAEFVAPGGALLVITRGRDTDEGEGKMPWPLTRAELALFRDCGLREVSFEDYLDREKPPVRRFRVEYREEVGIPQALVDLYADLPRQGPGSDASTLQAIHLLPSLPDSPRVLDLGCGTGSQTLVLARTLKARITAVDICKPFLDRLRSAATDAGLADNVETRHISIGDLDYPPESIDLIWSEGAAYFLGISRALRLWRPLLRPGGLVVFTEATWLTTSSPPEVATFWKKAYPAMDTIDGNVDRIKREGYDVLSTFILPAKDWWEEYYRPLRQRIAALRPKSADRPDLLEAIEDAEREIDMFERFSDNYSYVFYLLRKG